MKSITNTAQLAAVPKPTQLNSATLTNGTAKSIEENNGNFWSSAKSIYEGRTQKTNGWKMDLLSSNDNNSLFNNGPLAATNGTHSKSSSNGLTLNGNKLNGNTTKNGFHQSGAANVQNNLFTPDSDFVADFSSANIFDALNNKPSMDNGSTKPTLLNGHSNGVETNGNATHTNGNGLAPTDVNKQFDENFADFEHNTIYNAAGKLRKIRLVVV